MSVPPSNNACTPACCHAGGWSAIHLHRLLHITEPPSGEATAVVALLIGEGATAAHPLTTTVANLSSSVGIPHTEVPDVLSRLQDQGWITVTHHSGTAGTSVISLTETATQYLLCASETSEAAIGSPIAASLATPKHEEMP